MQEKVIEIIADIINEDKSKIKLNSSAGDFESWDSLAQVMIIEEIEEKLKVRLPIEKVILLETVEELVEAVNEYNA